MTDTHVVSALKTKRIQVASHIESLQGQLRQATIDLDHVEAALRLFDPEVDLAAHLKARMKEAGVTYAELVKRLKKHGFKDESEASVTMKLKRAAFSAAFLLACLAALEAEGVRLEDL